MDQLNNSGLKELLAKPEIDVAAVNVIGIETLGIKNPDDEITVYVDHKIIEWKSEFEELLKTLIDHRFEPTSIVFCKY